MANEWIVFNNNAQPAINDSNLNLLQQMIRAEIGGAVSGDTLPIGLIAPYTSDTIPTNWLLCDGSAISRTEYSDLFNVIGTTYGQGDGFTTFNIPEYEIEETDIPKSYIIKAFQSSGVVADVAQIDTDSDTDVYSCNYVNDKIGGVVVYSNSAGANTQIDFTFPTQGDSLANYSRIKIYSKVVMSGYTAYFITECEAVVGGSVSVEQTRMNSSVLWLSDSARYKMNASSLTKEEEADVRISADGSSAFNSNTTRTKIYKVELYK